MSARSVGGGSGGSGGVGRVEAGEALAEGLVGPGELDELPFENHGLRGDVQIEVGGHLVGDAGIGFDLTAEEGDLAEEVDAEGAGEDDEGDEGDLEGESEGVDLVFEGAGIRRGCTE